MSGDVSTCHPKYLFDFIFTSNTAGNRPRSLSKYSLLSHLQQSTPSSSHPASDITVRSLTCNENVIWHYIVILQYCCLNLTTLWPCHNNNNITFNSQKCHFMNICNLYHVVLRVIGKLTFLSFGNRDMVFETPSSYLTFQLDSLSSRFRKKLWPFQYWRINTMLMLYGCYRNNCWKRIY